MRALVTGGNGHLGYNLVKALLEGGHTVRASVRSLSDAAKTAPLKALGPVELVEAVLERPDQLRAAMEGIEVLFHAAAVYAYIDDGREQEIMDAAVKGAEAALRAAADARVRKVVLTSSAVTVPLTVTVLVIDVTAVTVPDAMTTAPVLQAVILLVSASMVASLAAISSSTALSVADRFAVTVPLTGCVACQNVPVTATGFVIDVTAVTVPAIGAIKEPLHYGMDDKGEAEGQDRDHRPRPVHRRARGAAVPLQPPAPPGQPRGLRGPVVAPRPRRDRPRARRFIFHHPKTE